MNIFVLDKDPRLAARALCDKHVCKMIIETTQLLCNPLTDLPDCPYKRTHWNHPCAKWARESLFNYNWLINHGVYLGHEFYYRYGHDHKCYNDILWAANNAYRIKFPQIEMTPFAQCMPDKYKQEDAVQAYRAYYIGEKNRFAKWNHATPMPEWWIDKKVE